MAEHVIVLHGLALNKYWMYSVALSLQRRGYIVHSISYPSRHHSFEQLVDEYVAPLVNDVPAEKVHFVVHSMGGLLVRLYVKKYGSSRIGRTVMIGTPNHGSEVADFILNWPSFRQFFGKAAEYLVTGPTGIAENLGPVSFDCGVIAGDSPWLHFLTGLLVKKMPRPSDGIVSIASTKVDGMKEHIIVDADHLLMVWHRSVWRHTARFLKDGTFTVPRL